MILFCESVKRVGKKINFITLGCSKNVVDSERIARQLENIGWSIVFDSDSTDVDVIIINTCGFIGDAKQESIDMILAAAEAKNRGQIEELYVIGCLSERYADDLRKEIPEVDQYFGVRTLDDIVKELGGEWDRAINNERKLTTPNHYAYLKISEGCSWGCSYCAIPIIRGKHVSVPMEELVDETRKLAAKGVKELIIIGQDTTYYGVDIYGERKLAELLRRVVEVDGIEWVRLHYAYPAKFPDDVIKLIADEPKMCKYLDIPLQHIADSQLKGMHRGIDKRGTIELIERLRRAIPNLALRTTMLVGFPGESEEDFSELLEFVEKSRFERLGVFAYSEEEGTHAALKMVDDVAEEVKQERVERLMELQNRVSLENNNRLIGRELKVIVDREEGEYYVARSEYDSPEVDQEVLIVSSGVTQLLGPGQFVRVRIVDVGDYDLYAELA